jgi:hypothetical protein
MMVVMWWRRAEGWVGWEREREREREDLLLGVNLNVRIKDCRRSNIMYMGRTKRGRRQFVHLTRD